MHVNLYDEGAFERAKAQDLISWLGSDKGFAYGFMAEKIMKQIGYIQWRYYHAAALVTSTFDWLVNRYNAKPSEIVTVGTMRELFMLAISLKSLPVQQGLRRFTAAAGAHNVNIYGEEALKTLAMAITENDLRYDSCSDWLKGYFLQGIGKSWVNICAEESQSLRAEFKPWRDLFLNALREVPQGATGVEVKIPPNLKREEFLQRFLTITSDTWVYDGAAKPVGDTKVAVSASTPDGLLRLLNNISAYYHCFGNGLDHNSSRTDSAKYFAY